MPLTAGTRLGPYEIQAPLGAGGMGEVYQARDTRLDRTVAIKVLPQHFRTDPALRERFEREARAISALSHPHICTLYDVGQHEDVDFLVMEHLSGETLAERLSRGPLPLPQALDLAVQMAQALDAAHRQRIVHRDLKPGNVMLTRSGTARQGMPQAKLLDFGIARLAPSGRPAPFEGAGLTTPPTMTTPLGGGGTASLTGQGSILGTLQYMAPEQLEGKEADARSDIFALGTTLYEMLAGRRPFEAKSQAGLVAAILAHDPPPLASPPAAPVPPALERILGKCLAKDPGARWQSAGDLADALRWVTEGIDLAAPSAPAGHASGSRWRAAGGWVAAAALAAVLAAVVVMAAFRPAGAPGPVKRLAIEPRAGESFVPLGLAFSPDGARLVYAAAREGRSQLYVRSLDRLEATPIAGTDGGRAPFFSPDGEWVGFFTHEALKKVSLRGGQPVTLARVPPVARGGTWLPDETIVFTGSQTAGLSQLPASGGPVSTLTEPGTGADDGAHLWPQLLPGGRDVLITVRTSTGETPDAGPIAVHSLETGARHVLLGAGGYARYLPSGRLAFVRSGTLMIAPIDLERRQVTGTPVPFIENVLVDPLGGPQFAASADGTLAYFEGRPSEFRTALVWVDRHGAERAALRTPGLAWGPALAPDGRRVLMSMLGAQASDVWMGDVTRGTVTRFTHAPADEFNAIWSPDGTRIVYSVFPIGRAPTLVWRPADGGGPAEPLAPARLHDAQFAGSISPDGRWVAYTQTLARAAGDIWVAPLEGEGTPRPLVSTPFDDYGPAFSPDGRWLAYTSNESGQYEVYAVPFPGPGAKRQISRDGGTSAVWARDGSEIFYLSGQRLMAVTIGPELTVGEPHALFEGAYATDSSEDTPRQYDVHPDGQRFLMVRVEEPEGAPPRLNVILGWQAELARARPGRDGR